MPPFRPQQPPPPPISIRPAVAADVPQLLALIQLYWDFEGIARFKGPQVESLLRRLLVTPDLGAAWVAEAKPQLLGYAVGVQVLSLEHQGLIGEIDEFFVLLRCVRAESGPRSSPRWKRRSPATAACGWSCSWASRITRRARFISARASRRAMVISCWTSR